MSILSNGKITLAVGSAIGRALGNDGAEMNASLSLHTGKPEDLMAAGARVTVNGKPGTVVEHKEGRTGFSYGVRLDVDPAHVYYVQPERVEVAHA